MDDPFDTVYESGNVEVHQESEKSIPAVPGAHLFVRSEPLGLDPDLRGDETAGRFVDGSDGLDGGFEAWSFANEANQTIEKEAP